MEPLMECGHIAMARDSEGNPYCVICDCSTVSKEKPDLSGRYAKCVYCSETKKSSYSLPFFEYKPNQRVDKYYCGCKGWD